MLSLIVTAALTLTLPESTLPNLIEGSTVVVYGNTPSTEEQHEDFVQIEIVEIVAGALMDSGTKSVLVVVPNDPYRLDPRNGRGLYFIRQCRAVGEVQGFVGSVGTGFMVQVERGELAHVLTIPEIKSFIRNSKLLGTEAKRVCEYENLAQTSN